MGGEVRGVGRGGGEGDRGGGTVIVVVWKYQKNTDRYSPYLVRFRLCLPVSHKTPKS